MSVSGLCIYHVYTKMKHFTSYFCIYKCDNMCVICKRKLKRIYLDKSSFQKYVCPSVVGHYLKFVLVYVFKQMLISIKLFENNDVRFFWSAIRKYVSLCLCWSLITYIYVFVVQHILCVSDNICSFVNLIKYVRVCVFYIN